MRKNTANWMLIIVQAIIMTSLSGICYAKQMFALKGDNSKMCIIDLVESPKEIDQKQAKKILVESFITEYQKPYLDISPSDIDNKLTNWRDTKSSVQDYYEQYFEEEFTNYTNGKIDYWLQAKINGRLVGWATFQKEINDPKALYMNLLVVLPEYQGKGIGKELTFAVTKLPALSNIETIHLLLRKKNAGGRSFYKKLGFFKNLQYSRADNYVDMDLLEPWTWTKH